MFDVWGGVSNSGSFVAVAPPNPLDVVAPALDFKALAIGHCSPSSRGNKVERNLSL